MDRTIWIYKLELIRKSTSPNWETYALLGVQSYSAAYSTRLCNLIDEMFAIHRDKGEHLQNFDLIKAVDFDLLFGLLGNICLAFFGFGLGRFGFFFVVFGVAVI